MTWGTWTRSYVNPFQLAVAELLEPLTRARTAGP